MAGKRDERRASHDMTQTNERETMSIEEAGRILGIGRSASYQAAATGDMPGVIRLGRKLLVSRRAIERLLESGNVGRDHSA